MNNVIKGQKDYFKGFWGIDNHLISTIVFSLPDR